MSIHIYISELNNIHLRKNAAISNLIVISSSQITLRYKLHG